MIVTVDNALWFAGMLTEAVVIGLLLFRRFWRTLPVFLIFCAWNLVGDVAGYIVSRHSPDSYTGTYLLVMSVDAVLELSVLIELAWSVLRPIRKALPRGALFAVGLLVMAAALAIWPFSGFGNAPGVFPSQLVIIRVQQTSAILRILFFLALTGFSQLLSMGWRDRELQVATGLGFYSLVNIGTALIHAQNMTPLSYTGLIRIVAASYLCSMLYWVASFAQKEPERKEFTPKMQSFLLALAGSARSRRVLLTDPGKSSGRENGTS